MEEEFCKDLIYIHSKKRIMLMTIEEKSLNLRENCKVKLILQNTMAAMKDNCKSFLRCLYQNSG